MRNVKNIIAYKTTDEKIFKEEDEAERHQSVINFYNTIGKRATGDKDTGEEEVSIYDSNDMTTLFKYLQKFYGFRNIWFDFSKIEFPVMVKWNKLTKELEIKEYGH